MLTASFQQALRYACDLHALQVRKGGAIPYVSHLLGVTALVLEDGGSEEEAIAALLHDAIEDQPHEGRTRAEIEQAFGSRVLQIVLACSDTEQLPKPPWKPRKERYLQHLATARDDGVLRVSVADKLHNARAVLRDLKSQGPSLWSRFNAGMDDQLWYYRSLVRTYRGLEFQSPMVGELEEVVEEIAGLARASGAPPS